VIRNNVVVLAVASLLVIAASPAVAQPRGGEPPFSGGGGGGGFGFGRPLFLEHLYRPELVMRHQGALALTPEQRAAIAATIKATQERLGTLQWELDAKSEAVVKLVEGDKVDVEQALAAAGQSIDLESQIKKEHLRLLLNIKNQLTPAQLAKLRELKQDRCPPERGGGPGERGRRGPPPPPGDDREPPGTP
jgi:Spy/CpxP family protein refolding chaperone